MTQLLTTALAVITSILVVAGCGKQASTPVGQSLAQVRAPLAQIPPGSWSEYSIKSAQQELALTVGLVAAKPDGHVIEYVVEGRSGSPMASVVTAATYSRGRSIDEIPVSTSIQVAAFAPMQQPTNDPTFDPIKGPQMDATAWVADDETITTSAGTFVTSHFRRREADQSSVEVWVARTVFPTGVVRMREVSANQEETLTELIAIGNDATARVTTQPEAFDRDLLDRQLLAATNTPGAIE
jgi:hypothetical protein